MMNSRGSSVKQRYLLCFSKIIKLVYSFPVDTQTSQANVEIRSTFGEFIFLSLITINLWNPAVVK